MSRFLVAGLALISVTLSCAETPIPPPSMWIHLAGSEDIPVQASLAVAPKGGGSTTKILYTIRNPTAVARKFILWETPLEKRMKFDSFQFSSGIVARYAGMVAKRRQVIYANNTFTIAAKSEVSKVIDLHDYYDFFASGSGNVWAKHPLLEVTDELHVRSFSLSTNAVAVHIPKAVVVSRMRPAPGAAAAVAPQALSVCEADTGGTCRIFGCYRSRGPTVCHKSNFWSYKCLCQPGYCAVNGACVKSAVRLPPLNTHMCDGSERRQILDSAEDAKLMLECALQRGSADPRGYFGSSVTPPRVGQVLSRSLDMFNKQDYSVTCTKNEKICDDEGYTFACVYPTDMRHQINLATQFWEAPRNSIGGLVDTQAGTLIHESTHFDDIGDTSDLGYGNRIIPPELAMRNADTFEYYCETCDTNYESVLLTQSTLRFPGVGLAAAAGFAAGFSIVFLVFRKGRGKSSIAEPLMA